MTTRTLVLLDIENLLGGPRFTAAEVRRMRPVVEALAGLPGDYQAVLACSSGAGLVEAGLGWDGARRVWRPGPNGADLALAEEALDPVVVRRFDRVVIGSGDGGLFAMTVRHLRRHGVQVTVVARAGGVSRALTAAAGDLRLLGAQTASAA